jgi:hypothetical protein
MSRGRRWFGAAGAVAVVAGLAYPIAARAISAAPLVPVPRAQCGPGSDPETGMQGRVSPTEVANGRAARGYRCNTVVVGHYGDTSVTGAAGGYRVYRYVDPAGHRCAFYDSVLLFPLNATTANPNPLGVFVLDMSNPAHPVRTATLQTPAMLSPHESLSLNAKRGLLAADLGNPVTAPGIVDVYDVAHDCRHPVLKSSLLAAPLGHEGTFSPDGKTFWVASPAGDLTAVDVTNPSLPVPLWTSTSMHPHGLNVSDDGNTLYYADLGSSPGLAVLDVSQIQRRVANPQVGVISHLGWDTISIPQVPLPVTINGHPYLVEIDEFASTGGSSGISASPAAKVGAARIIDIADIHHPRVISNIRLEVNMAANRAGLANDPGSSSALQGYAGHYCAVPQRRDPGVVACSFIQSGLRVFDIRDPFHPKEIAYYNAPVRPSSTGDPGSDFAMSAPAFDPAHGQIWYSDGNHGFYAVHLTNGVWPFPAAAPAKA